MPADEVYDRAARVVFTDILQSSSRVLRRAAEGMDSGGYVERNYAGTSFSAVAA